MNLGGAWRFRFFPMCPFEHTAERPRDPLAAAGPFIQGLRMMATSRPAL
jgi:hypothetical protein